MAPGARSGASKDPAVRHNAHASTANQTTISSPSAKPRKRPHAALEGEQHGHDEDDNDTIHVANDLQYHNHKKSRPVEWPLQNEETKSIRKESQKRRRSAPAKSPSSRKHTKTKPIRPSRFIEGSMNDRASAKPPSLYTGDESNHDGHTKQPTEGDQGGQEDSSSGSGHQWYDAGIEPSRPSGMFRFGKAIVNAFNPIWHGIHGMWKDNKDEEAPPATSVLQERQIKAEKAYAELKKAGFRGTKGAPNGNIPTIKYEDTAEVLPSATNRDSGIDVDERSSAERKRDGRVFDTDESLMLPPISSRGGSISPMSDALSSQKPSLHVRKPSFQSLKNVKSHIQLPSAKKTPGHATPMSTVGKDKAGQTLKKQPSKKELKLSKKVSDLETKLELARRELRQAMGDAPPVPDLPVNLGLRPFKPGALPSLPSGLIVDGRGNVDFDKSKGAEGELHATESVANASDLARLPTTQPSTTTQPSASTKPSVTTQLSKVDDSIAALADVLLQSIEASEESRGEKPAPQRPASKKRKSGRLAGDDAQYKPESDDDDDLEWTLTKTVTPKRKPGRPNKALKVEQAITPGPTAPKQKSQSQTKVPQQTPNPSKPAAPAKPSPTSPPIPQVFDPTKVDRAKLLKMRTEPNPFIPFGELSDDILNLRKLFPTVTDDQLVTYFTSVSTAPATVTSAEAEAKAEGKAKPHPQPPDQTKPLPPAPASTEEPKIKASANATFAAINHSPHTPVLGRPRSASPSKPTDATKNAKRALSPPPPLARHIDSIAEAVEEGDEVVTLDPARDVGVPPLPRLPLEVEKKNLGLFEKALPAVGKEEYEWPEDVF
ncbi:MAG: hypothetical protein FRX48_06457 [Lasallia pustulata]|uniref:Uncharacterized protein n=1 Tax=Lasallia pustulata TaxID=136370 RepID=A0A5M8PLM1_9LECA|nr:MAG: hypothetical protein FRX48_06457 [Lasallia pustulata]